MKQVDSCSFLPLQDGLFTADWPHEVPQLLLDGVERVLSRVNGVGNLV